MFAFLHARLTLLRQRRDLARLDDHMLRDIGLTRAEALTEAQRPAWDAPGHWVATTPRPAPRRAEACCA
jgi:hypothetical protein